MLPSAERALLIGLSLDEREALPESALSPFSPLPSPALPSALLSDFSPSPFLLESLELFDLLLEEDELDLSPLFPCPLPPCLSPEPLALSLSDLLADWPRPDWLPDLPSVF